MKTPLALCISVALLAACSDSDNDGTGMTAGMQDDAPLLDVANAETVLKDVIRFVNEQPFRAVLAEVPSFAFDAGGTASADGVEMTGAATEVSVDDVPGRAELAADQDAGTLDAPVQRSEFACANGGTIELFQGAFPTGRLLAHTDCTRADATLNGGHFQRSSPVRPASLTVVADDLAVAPLDGSSTRTLTSGTFTASDTSFVVASAQRTAGGVDYVESVEGAVVRVDGFEASLDYQAPGGLVGGDTVNAIGADGTELTVFRQRVASELQVDFDITAAWSDGRPASVSVRLEHDDEYDYFDGWSEGVSDESLSLTAPDGSPLTLDLQRDGSFFWKRGELTVTAADGSTLTLAPRDASTWLATVAGQTLVLERDAEGLAIDCAPRGVRVDESIAEIADCSLATQDLAAD